MPMLAGLPAFLAYFAGSVVLLGIFLVLHAWLLPVREWQLIRQGNAAAALSLAGAAGGFALPLTSAIVHSAGFADMVVWAAIAGAVQFAAFAAMRLLRRDVAGALARGDMAEATVIAAGSLILGTLNAACLS